MGGSFRFKIFSAIMRRSRGFKLAVQGLHSFQVPSPCIHSSHDRYEKGRVVLNVFRCYGSRASPRSPHQYEKDSTSICEGSCFSQSAAGRVACQKRVT